MRHRKSGRQLNRNSSHRKAMFKNMANSLLLHETIKTTLPKAKELIRFVEPLITKAKVDSVAGRRNVFAKLRNDEIVAKLFTQLGPFYKDRCGGYVRVLKAGFRTNDKAPMAIVQLVDVDNFNEYKTTAEDKSTATKDKKTVKVTKKATADKKTTVAETKKAKETKTPVAETKETKTPVAETKKTKETKTPKEQEVSATKADITTDAKDTSTTKKQ